ncbi:MULTISPECIES: winged helix-turn-helix transcriptional regulator [unclassified Chryseobacterium]|uniref:winged helix-turn-helix transcriptional regulator n=1 Tax=unclassified Chryseobacterium TaxID=2593645 RepID=UPI00300FF392
MNKRKINSTNHINEVQINENCGIAYTLSLIGGRWKINILSYLLNENRLRYNELLKRLSGISERMLIAKLKELENDNLINRIVYQQVPPKVEYELTDLGKSLSDIMKLMDSWGEKQLKM